VKNVSQTKAIEQSQPVPVRQYIGWILAVLVPLVVLQTSGSLAQPIRVFLTVASMAVCMWVFDLVPAFVPAVLILVVSILFEIAPKEVVFSGFFSDAFFICLGIFILASQVSSSGLIYRAALMLMRRTPDSKMEQSLIVFTSGSFLSIILPSPLGRAALINPLIFDLIAKAPKPRGKQKTDITPLVTSGLYAPTLLSTIFLTGNPLNLVMLGLFSAQTQYRFQWLYWLQATIVVGLILTVGYLLIIYWQTSKSNLQPIPDAQVDKLLEKLGPITTSEWGAIAGIVIFGVGILTQNYHHIEPVWLAMGIALAIFLYGGLTAKDMRSNIDWPTLIFVAAIVSWGPIMSQLGLNSLISAQVTKLGLDTLMQENLLLGIGLLSIIIILIRLVFPGGPTFIILMSALIPLADKTGISPWVLGFITLTISEAFVLPYQHGVSNLMVEELKSRGLQDSYRANDVLIANVLLLALRVAAVFVAILYWRAIAIL